MFDLSSLTQLSLTHPSLATHILHLAGRVLANRLRTPKFNAHTRIGDRHGDNRQTVGDYNDEYVVAKTDEIENSR